MSRLRRASLVFAVGGSLVLLLVSTGAKRATAATNKPRLAVVLIVDQMRSDYLDRFKSQFNGGLGRMLRDGAVFTRAYHDHAITETSPGHATLSTGMTPAHHGIVANNWYDRTEGKMVYSCEDIRFPLVGVPEGPGRSPLRLEAPTLPEWLAKKSPRSRVVSIALKDRSAILLAGRDTSADVFWYSSGAGSFVTSAYYAQNLPDWVLNFNRSRWPDSSFYHERTWDKFLPAAESLYLKLAGPDTSGWEYRGLHNADTFPHLLTYKEKPDSTFYEEMLYTPFGDELTLRFATDAVRHYELGEDDDPDLLLISLSSADLIGHRYGPNSQEVLDYYLRLDRYLAGFFTFLDDFVGRDGYLVALSSDHGVLPLPNFLASQGLAWERPNMPVGLVQIHRKQREVEAELGARSSLFLLYKKEELEQYKFGVNLNYAAAESAGINRKMLEETAAKKFRELPFAADVYTSGELADKMTPDRPYLRQYRQSFRSGRGPDLYFRLKEYTLFSKEVAGTSHGSPYEYDTQVPMIFTGPGISPRIFSDSVRSVDFAPTVFVLLGYRPPKNLDGVSLAPKISSRR